jgi:iron complex outermembrane receptor protein
VPHKKNVGLSAAIVAVLSVSSSAALFAQGLPNPLPPQPLVDALEAFSRQSPLQVVYSADVAKGVMSPGARAGQSDEETLRELLRDTGLTFEFVNERTVTVTRSKNHQASPARAADDRRTSAAKQARNEVRLASAESGAVSAENGVDTGTQGSGNDRGAVRLEEVVVTGSHIRGAQNFSSPVITFDREDIERSG